MKSELAEMAMDQQPTIFDDEAPETVPVPHALVPHLDETAILLDIDGTLLDLMPTPREVWVPPGLSETLKHLTERTSGALAPTGMDLRLDLHRTTETLSDLAGLSRADRDTACWNIHAVASQKVLRLELMDSHDPVPPSRARGRPRF